MAYCVKADIRHVFGTSNVATWSDLSGNDTDDDTRITRACTEAEAFIDDYLRGTHYTISLANASGNTPTSITLMAAQLAGVTLYESRGVEDYAPRDGKPVHKLTWYREHVESELENIRNGTRKIDAL